jgi:hypothetical protein
MLGQRYLTGAAMRLDVGKNTTIREKSKGSVI